MATLSAAVFVIAALAGLAAGQPVMPFPAAKPILDAFAGELPAELKRADEAQWVAWARREDAAVRARLDQGELDSMVNLLMFGTSFTVQPRIDVKTMIDGAQNAILQSRVRELLQGLRNPGANERLIFLQGLLKRRGMDVETSSGYEKSGLFLLDNLRRALEEQIKFAQRLEKAHRQTDSDSEFAERSRLFRDRGISLDTSLLPNLGIEEALSELKKHGVLGEGGVQQAAVIGPGLDFTDKESGFDYYPQQTLQPFALYNSLLRLGLAKDGEVRISVFDISSRVLDHLQRARERAQAGQAYTVQLPRDPAAQWLPASVRYWQSFGDRIGAAVPPIAPPQGPNGLESRAVNVRPAVVLSCLPVDLNIVLGRMDLPAGERFDLVVATNVFVYYDTFEQALALKNVSKLLKPGGFLLTNNGLPELPETSMPSAGFTTVRYGEGATSGDHIVWYRNLSAR
jgi:hypothetical protein